MLEKLILKNFRCHKDLEIDLDQIVCITGNNDVGKSTVLNGLEWLLTNNLRGDDFINWDSDSCTVKGVIDGKEIIRGKGKQGNLFSLDGKKFHAFGSQVPSEISQLVNVSPASFAGQHDPVYCLSQSPGSIGKSLNEIVNLTVIDRSLANVSKSLRDAKATHQVSKQRLAQAKQRRSKLHWVKDYAARVENLVNRERNLSDYRAKTSLQSLLVTKAKDIATRLGEELKTLPRLLEKLASLVTKVEEYESYQAKTDKLNNLLTQIRSVQHQCSKSKEMLNQLQKKHDNALKKLRVCPLCNSVLHQ